MAQDSEERGGSLAGNGFVWLALLLIGSAIIHEAPFDVSRPRATAPGLRQHVEDQNVEARLWQDPYAAVAAAIRAEEAHAAAAKRAADGRDGRRDDAAGNAGDALQGHDVLRWNPRSGICTADKTAVLAAMVSGGPYPGNAESRRRTRFAVVSALTASGYIPVDEEHIGYLHTERVLGLALNERRKATPKDLREAVAVNPPQMHGHRLAREDGGVTLPADIPWERFTRAQTALDRAPGGAPSRQDVRRGQDCMLVLWFDEDDLARRPLGQVAALQDVLAYSRIHDPDLGAADGAATKAGAAATVPLTLIGPTGSRVLEAIVRDEIRNLAVERLWHAGKAQKPDGRQAGTSARPACVDAAIAVDHEAVPYCPLDVGLYSFSASVPDRLLVRFASDLTGLDKSVLKEIGAGFDSNEPLTAQIRTPSVREILERAGIHFHSFILDDDVVIRALGCELQRRHLDVACAGEPPGILGLGDVEGTPPAPLHGRPGQVAHVVVVSEWDTLYGRTLPEEVGRGLGLEPVPELSRPDCDKATLQGFGYLRGLDGQLPARAEDIPGPETSGARERAGGETQALDPYVARGALERAEGQSQFDYLRRLADRVKATDDWLRSRCGRAHVDAIGVLGSDVYDKLLVLQALRPKFPDALFFTTDLDARFQHPDVIEWTRNLLVTSSLGLDLGESWQGGVPPFRDSYQTSAFLATRLAIGSCPPHFPCGAELTAASQLIGSPLVYEIGRNSTFAFDPYARPPADGSAAVLHHPAPRYWKCLACQAPDALVPTVGALPALIGFLVPEMLVALGLWRSLPSWRLAVRWQLRHTLRRRQGRLMLWGVVAVALLLPALTFAGLNASIGQVITEFGQGEPMRLADGISAWPTLLLRLANALLCLYFLMHGAAVQRQNLRNIAMALRLGKMPATLRGEYRGVQDNLDWVDRLIATFSVRLLRVVTRPGRRLAESQPFNALTLWRIYVWQGRFAARMARAGVGVLGLLVIGLAATQLFGQVSDPPGRGVLIPRLNLAVTLVAVFSMQFLVLFVADALLFCTRFIRDIGREQAIWPDSTLEHFARKFALDRKYLEDWIRIRFIELRTECLTRQVYFPFVAVGIMVFARNPLFDRWPLNLAILLMQVLSGLIVLIAAVRLRQAAEQARELAVSRIRNHQVALRGNVWTSPVADQLDLLARQVSDSRLGAFAPFSHQPFVKALLLPVSGFGGAALLERLIGMTH